MKGKNNINISNVPEVSKETAEEYGNKIDLMLKKVNQDMSEKGNLNQLIGDNPISKMKDNHKNHADFMYNSFLLNDSELFLNTIVWVYKTYNKHGFSYDYFPVELKVWISAIKEYINPENQKAIIKVYRWMLNHHQTFVEESKKAEGVKSEISNDYLDLYNQFLKHLLQGNYNRCLLVSKEHVKSKEEMLKFFEYIIKPAMYQVGTLWADGEIYIAQEHLASSIVSRINSFLYSQFISLEVTKRKAVITSIANEFHEIGARIIADALEINGWDVNYLGANTPLEDLIDLLIINRPLLVGLSVSMPFNIDNLNKAVKRIREESKLEDIKILVGGKVLNDNPELWKKLDVDACAKDCQQAVQVAEKWLKEVRDADV